MIQIRTYDFDDKSSNIIAQNKDVSNWPVVYIISNSTEAYIGETTNVSSRINQHYMNDERKKLKQINVITSNKFNKSSVLDLESFLIKYMSADKKFKLQNGNNGLQNHNYYHRDQYRESFKNVWEQLKAMGIVTNNLIKIANSDLFKYSPYKSLTDDQYNIVDKILHYLTLDIAENKKSSMIVRGGAGTGKTILGIYLIKLLVDASKKSDIFSFAKDIHFAPENLMSQKNNFRVGLVVPMDNLRATLRKCFKNIEHLSPAMVLSPNDVAKEEEIYDLLIVDEAHRLRRRVNLTQYSSFDTNNSSLSLGKDGTELDWILKKSKHQIFFYDKNQSIRPTDIRSEKMDLLINNPANYVFDLQAQMRCLKGGEKYINYVKAIFSNKPPKEKSVFEEYDFQLFYDVDEMVIKIKSLDKIHGLCRNVAGYAWTWRTKNSVEQKLHDIEIKGYKYVWNSKLTDWINSPNSINEIGSIHTTQGYDLNYTGLIIGSDLRYDTKNERLFVDRSNYFDVKGKNTTTDEELLQYLLNIYSTMCLRGVLGTFLYVCDDGLRDYLKRYL